MGTNPKTALGGGGTFVVRGNNIPLIIAGGGGGIKRCQNNIQDVMRP